MAFSGLFGIDSVAINSQFDEIHTQELAGYLKTQNGLQLVVWEHTNIPKLGHALGLGKDSLSWNGSDFDTIWIVTFPNGRKHAPKLVKSTEGLSGLPNQCPTGKILSRLIEPAVFTAGSMIGDWASSVRDRRSVKERSELCIL
jgi:hypothetical protein